MSCIDCSKARIPQFVLEIHTLALQCRFSLGTSGNHTLAVYQRHRSIRPEKQIAFSIRKVLSCLFQYYAETAAESEQCEQNSTAPLLLPGEPFPGQRARAQVGSE